MQGSAPEAIKYINAYKALRKLDKAKAHVKTYRPQYLVLCGDPRQRVHLVSFANQLRKGKVRRAIGRGTRLRSGTVASHLDLGATVSLFSCRRAR